PGANNLSLSGAYSDKPVLDRLQKSNRSVGLHGFAEIGGYIGSTWSLTPQAGYFVARRLITGLAIPFGKYSLDAGPLSTDRSQRIFSFAPEAYARYYIADIRVKPFIQLTGGGAFQRGRYQAIDQSWEKIRRVGPTGGVGIGLSWFPSKSWAIEGIYSRKFSTPSRWKDANESLRFRMGVSIFLN